MNTKSRSYNAVRNISFGMVKQIVTLVLAFATKTIFVRMLGAEYTGINGLYSNILTLLSLAELGVGNVMVYSLYAPVREHNISAIKSLMTYFKKIYRVIAISISGLGIAIIPFLKIIINSNLPEDKLVVYYLLFLLNSVASYFVVYKTTLLQADQKIYIQNLVNTISLIVQYIIQIVYLLLTRNYIGFLTIQVMCTIVQNVVLSYIADRTYPYLKDKAIPQKQIEKTSLNENIKSMFLYKLATIIINNTDNILISMLLGTVYVGYYSNYYSLITYVTTFVTILIQGITAGLGNLNAEHNEEKSYKMFCNLIYLFNFIAAFCVATFANVVQDFIPIWLGKEYLMDTGTVGAILFTFYISTVTNPVWMYRETMGLFKQIKYVMFLTAILNIIFSIILGLKFGVAGIIGATGIARICTIIWYEPRILYKKFAHPVCGYFRMQLKYLMINMLILILSVAVCRKLGHNFGWILIKTMFCCVITVMVHIICMRNTDEIDWIKCKLFKILPFKTIKR